MEVYLLEMALSLDCRGAALWGTIGIFIKELSSMGFTPIQIVVLRALSAAVSFLILTFFLNRSLLKIHIRDSYYFIGTGLLSIAFFNWCYFKTMNEVSLSVAAVLLYTAPAFVLILSRIFFRDLITKRKWPPFWSHFSGVCLSWAICQPLTVV